MGALVLAVALPLALPLSLALVLARALALALALTLTQLAAMLSHVAHARMAYSVQALEDRERDEVEWCEVLHAVALALFAAMLASHMWLMQKCDILCRHWRTGNVMRLSGAKCCMLPTQDSQPAGDCCGMRLSAKSLPCYLPPLPLKATTSCR